VRTSARWTVANSLLTGKRTGNFENKAPTGDFDDRIQQRLQSFAAKFPARRSREFLSKERGICTQEQGIYPEEEEEE
jgi:hypothetical protein